MKSDLGGESLKNLVLVMVFVLIIMVFIAFNYLLWDRENFQEINLSKTAAIDAFSKQLKNLEERNKLLESDISSLNDEIEDLVNNKEYLSKQLELKDKEIEPILLEIDEKEQFINILKQQIDISPIKDIVKDWVNKISTGDLEGAYNLHLFQDTEDGSKSIEKFAADYKDVIKSIEIKSIDLVLEKSTMNDVENCIALKVVLNVNKSDEFKGQFYNGINTRYFIFDYDIENGIWHIKDISYYY